jgi:hypothetical protein
MSGTTGLRLCSGCLVLKYLFLSMPSLADHVGDKAEQSVQDPSCRRFKHSVGQRPMSSKLGTSKSHHNRVLDSELLCALL